MNGALMTNASGLRYRRLVLRFFVSALAAALLSCGGRPAGPVRYAEALGSYQEEARFFLDFYNPAFIALYTEAGRAAWVAATDVTEEHTGARTGADTAFSAFTGNAFMIERARELLEQRQHLNDVTIRQLEWMLHWAASAPQTNPELARARIAAESRQSARLDGYQFCMRRGPRPAPAQGEGSSVEPSTAVIPSAGTPVAAIPSGAPGVPSAPAAASSEPVCLEPVTTNDIDRVLIESRDLAERRRAWEASKEVGPTLRDGLLELRGLRNGVAREMGHRDFFSFQVQNYGMTTEEMMSLLERLVQETRPLYSQIHCWARYELAARYGVRGTPPRLIPAHWIGNRWSQEWPGLVEGVEMDSLLEGRDAEWVVHQAERFYVSMGFTQLPQVFWERSDLYPVPEGEARRKNAHASAWHIDLEGDVRSLMSVEPNWSWFTTTHHELGHIYYYISYSRQEVPPLLREGANRGYHEGVGDLIALASSQLPYLREIGLLGADQEIDQSRYLLDTALTGPIVFLPFAAGVMSHFEKELYADELSSERLNTRWWELVARFQGVAPPSERPADGCDACTKTHINDDPGQYYDYAIANVLVYQLHDHICRQILHQDPHACNYYNHREVGDFLRAIMEPGATRDWQEVLRERTGREMTAEPMLEYFRPLMEYLQEQNRGRDCSWPG